MAGTSVTGKGLGIAPDVRKPQNSYCGSCGGCLKKEEEKEKPINLGCTFTSQINTSQHVDVVNNNNNSDKVCA